MNISLKVQQQDDGDTSWPDIKPKVFADTITEATDAALCGLTDENGALQCVALLLSWDGTEPVAKLNLADILDAADQLKEAFGDPREAVAAKPKPPTAKRSK